MSLEELYKEVILDHYRAPRNKGRLDPHDVMLERNNPLCGDEIELYLQFDGEGVGGITFEGKGCSISQASASMMTEAVSGRTVEDAMSLAADVRGMLGGEVEPDEDSFGDLVALKGVVKYPIRIKCAVLAWDVLQEAVSGGRAADGAAPH